MNFPRGFGKFHIWKASSRIENGKRGAGEKVAKKLAKPLEVDYKLLTEIII